MFKIESDCCDCGKPCAYKACTKYEVARLYCDKCGDECGEVFEYDGEQLCEYCLLETVPKITIESALEEYYDER